MLPCMKVGQWQIRGEIRRHTREIFVSFCRELLVPKKFSYNLKEFRLFSMSARCQQEIFFLGKLILLYARNENFSSMPPLPCNVIKYWQWLIWGDFLALWEKFSHLSVEHFQFLHYAKNFPHAPLLALHIIL